VVRHRQSGSASEPTASSPTLDTHASAIVGGNARARLRAARRSVPRPWQRLASTAAPAYQYLNGTTVVTQDYVNLATGELAVEARAVERTTDKT
jgi:hypothetical protein